MCSSTSFSGKSSFFLRLAFLFILVMFSQSLRAETLSGVLDVVWGDAEPGSSKPYITKYTLAQDNDERVPLQIKDSQIKEVGGLSKINGKRVIIDTVDLPVQQRGIKNASAEQVVKSLKLDISSQNDLAIPQALSGSQEYVSILCKFNDIADEGEDWNYFNNMYGTEPGQLGHYWQEASSDKLNLSGSRAYGGEGGNSGWYTLEEARSTYVNTETPNGNLSLLFDDCVAAADDHIDFTSVKGINLMFNATIGSYAWGGGHYATLDGVSKVWPTTWEPTWGWANMSVMAHEMGHSFGLPHSNNSDEDSNPYDSPWTVMSDAYTYTVQDSIYGDRAVHINAYEKDRLDWFLSAEIATIENNTSNTLIVDSLSSYIAGAGAYRMVKVPYLDGSGYYTIETRLKTGEYEAELPGEAVIIHSVEEGRSEPSWVVDANTPPANFADTEGNMWKVGETFTDSANNVSITIDANTANGFQISIERTPQPGITSPTDGSTLQGNTETFSWTANGNSVTAWQLKVGTSVGAADIYTYSGTATSTQVTGLPTDGSTVYVRLEYEIDSVWSFKDTSYSTILIVQLCPDGTVPNDLSNDDFESGLGTWVHAAIEGTDAWSHSTINPASGSGHIRGIDLDTTSDSFMRSYMSQSPVQLPSNAFLTFNHLYDFESYFDGGVVEYTTDQGMTWNDAGGLFTDNGYNEDALSSGNPLGSIPAFSASSGGYQSSRIDLNSLAGSSVDFRFRVGTDSSVGATGWDIDDVRLYSCVQQPSEPTITSPVSGSTLSGSIETIDWNNNGTNVTQWYLYAGSSAGAYDYAFKGGTGDTSSSVVTGLPVDGSTVYITIWFNIDGSWVTLDATYTAATEVANEPEITSHTSESVLSGSIETFSWDDNGANVTQWYLYAGSTEGAYDYAFIGGTGSETNATVTGLPVDGSAVYITIWFNIGGSWVTVDDTYTAAIEGGNGPEIISPVSGSTLSGSIETVSWDLNGAVVSEWYLYAGSSEGDYDYVFQGGAGSITNTAIEGLPVDGSEVYIRIWFVIDGAWVSVDAVYTAAGAADN